MHLTKPQLLTPLQSALGAIDTKGVLPILTHALVRIAPDGVTVTGTDLQQEIVASAPAEIAGEPLTLCLPARKTADILKLLPDSADLDLIVADQKLTLRAGRSRYTINLLDPEQFPAMDHTDAQLGEVSFDAAHLGTAFKRIAPAMANGDVRYYLNGACLDIRGDTAHLVGSDGHRMHVARLSVSTSLKGDRQAILPRAAVLELAKRLPDKGALVAALSERAVTVDLPGLKYTTKLIEGRFPDWTRVMPKPAFTLDVDREQLIAALRRARLLSNEKYHGCALALARGTLTLTAQNDNAEQSEEILEIAYDGPEHRFGYNTDYLDAALGVLTTTRADIGLTDIGNALITAPDDDSAQLIVMPMRL